MTPQQTHVSPDERRASALLLRNLLIVRFPDEGYEREAPLAR